VDFGSRKVYLREEQTTFNLINVMSPTSACCAMNNSKLCRHALHIVVVLETFRILICLVLDVGADTLDHFVEIASVRMTGSMNQFGLGGMFRSVILCLGKDCVLPAQQVLQRIIWDQCLC
jgi:hypothetical protein